MSKTSLPNLSTLASYGTEWTSDGTRHQMVNPIGAATLMFGTHTGGKWHLTTVTAPERFGMDSPPESFAEFLNIVVAFIGEDD